jgi:hypothetical protein
VTKRSCRNAGIVPRVRRYLWTRDLELLHFGLEGCPFHGPLSGCTGGITKFQWMDYFRRPMLTALLTVGIRLLDAVPFSKLEMPVHIHLFWDRGKDTPKAVENRANTSALLNRIWEQKGWRTTYTSGLLIINLSKKSVAMCLWCRSLHLSSTVPNCSKQSSTA